MDHAIRLDVLLKNQIGKVYVFGKWTERGTFETHLTYLGEVKAKNNQVFKIMNSTWIHGLSARATNRILVFNGNNEYIGNYYVSTIGDLPTELKNGALVFKNMNNDCDQNIVSKISLKNGLPKQFFRKCKGLYGDFYSFEG